MAGVADQRHVDAAQSALQVASAVPGLETVLRVGRGEDDGALTRVEKLLEARTEGLDLGGTDEGPGSREEDQCDSVAGVGISTQRDL